MSEIFTSMRASCVIAVEEVPAEETKHYGIIDPGEGEEDWVRIKNMVEKPDPAKAPSRWAVAGRYAFSPIIFDMIRRVKPDKRGEIQLTDAIQLLCEEGKRVLALKLPKKDKRYDIGNFPSYFETFVEFALADPLYGPDLKKRLRELLAE
jgi:UTP--glucose-1-phosphate uridylyltransferase